MGGPGAALDPIPLIHSVPRRNTIMKFRTIAALGAVALVAATGCASVQQTANQQSHTTDQATLASSKKSKKHHKRRHPKTEMTRSQANALASATDYLENQSFSKKGLIEQLSSSAGEGYPKA